MYKVVNKQIITDSIKRIDIEAKEFVSHFKPGQFAVVMADAHSKRLLMTPIEIDSARGIVSFIFKEADNSLQVLGSLRVGDFIYAVAGPFAENFHPQKLGAVLCVTHNMYATHLYMVCKALKEAGNKVVSIMDFENKKEVILEAKMRRECQHLSITVPDTNAYKKQDSVFELVPKLIAGESIRAVYACGPIDFLVKLKGTVFGKTPLNVLLTPVLLKGKNVFDTTAIRVQKNIVYPCFEKGIYDVNNIDFDQIIKSKKAQKEYQWQILQLPQGQPAGAPKILTRLLSGLEKKKP